MTEAGDFEEIGATGEIKNSTLTEETLSNQVKTYGRMFGITRQMLINDDLGACWRFLAYWAKWQPERLRSR